MWKLPQKIPLVTPEVPGIQKPRISFFSLVLLLALWLLFPSGSGDPLWFGEGWWGKERTSLPECV